MGIKIKNLQTGEFEKFNIPALKGEKGEPGEIEPSEKVDYIGKQHSKLRDTMNANVDYIIKTAIGEFNYLDYEGQHITATNSIEGHARSAILSGQTLVNVDSYYNKNSQDFQSSNIDSVSEDGYIQLTANGTWRNAFTRYDGELKPSTKYLVVVDVKTNTLADGSQPFRLFTEGTNSNGVSNVALATGQSKWIGCGVTGVFKYIVTTASDLSNAIVTLRNYVSSSVTSGILVYRTMMIEYVEGMENWDIPFFRGMQSVNLYPGQKVLKITWKSGQYYNDNGELTTANANANHRYFDEYVEIHPNHVYTISGNNNYKNLNFYDANKNHVLKVSGKSLWGDGSVKDDLYATAPTNAKYMRYNMAIGSNMDEGTTIFDTTLGIPLMKTSITETYFHKMPVLTTTGKNLFVAREDEYVVNGISVKNENGNIVFGGSSNGYSSFDLITGEKFGGHSPNWKSYYQDKILHRVTGEFTFKASLGKPQGLDVGNGIIHEVYVVYDDDKINSIQYDSRSGNEVTKTVKFNVESHINGFFVTRWYGGSCEGLYINSPQIEQGISATQYEPYKTNILTTPQDIVLRKVGDVADTLDLVTGELTERIGEVVLDGSENWEQWWHLSKTVGFMLTIGVNGLNRTNSIANSLTFGNINGGGEANDIEGYNFSGGNILIRLNKTKLNGEFTDYSDEQLVAFKNYLSQNPITIQYQLATESIKTVDLSDNVVYSYKGITHYSCSSEEGSLVPTLSVKVPTDTQLTIQEQKAATQTLLIKNMDLQQSIKEVQAMNLAFNTALYNSFNSIREEVEDIKKHVSTNENLEGSF